MIKKIPDLTKFKALLIPLAIFLVIFLSLVLFLKPQILALPKAQRELSLEKAKLAKLTAKMAFLEGLQEPELEKKTKTVLAILPAEKDLPRTLLAIRSLTSEVGLELQGVQVEPGEISTGSNSLKSARQGLGFLEFKITLQGDWIQLENFLSRVEGVAPLMRLANIEVSSSAFSTIEADLLLDSFFLPLPTSLGPSESALVPLTPQEDEIYQQFVASAPAREEPAQFSPPAGRENPFIF